MAKTALRSVELEPIDRLEDKLKALVGMVDRLKHEQAVAAEDNQRLTRELQALREQLGASQQASVEILQLKEERDVIRGRVGDMLKQLEALNL
jgi:regulator of replication initiation timing